MTEKCKDCRWLEFYEGRYICGYVAEVYLLARRVDPESACEINKYENRRKNNVKQNTVEKDSF